jgi:hypothetical protein
MNVFFTGIEEVIWQPSSESFVGTLSSAVVVES